MDTKSGQIRYVSDSEFTKRETPLSESEYQGMIQLPEKQRPMELALMRFKQQRKKMGLPVDIRQVNAFQLGYLCALSDVSQGAQ